MLKLSRLPSGEPEIFASIQGEGPTRGTPSVFVRLALCNLRCGWCDTKYTWDWEHHDPGVEILDLDAPAVAGSVDRLHHRNVVITGGEPLVQQAALIPLLGALKTCHRIEIETNATIAPTAAVADAVDQWNVSPKLANSGNPIQQREVAGVLTWFAAHPSAFFKLVVSEPSDLQEVDRLVETYRIPTRRVFLMPQAEDARALAERAEWLRPACTAAGYGFTPRLQISLWGVARAR